MAEANGAAQRDPIPASEFREEQYEEGLAFRTSARTITEADVVAFAHLSGDWNPQHCDAEWAQRNSPFGARIAHGALVASVAEGLVPPHLLTTALSTRSEIVIKNPVLIGDTVHVIGARREVPDVSAAQPSVELRVLNQRNALVARMAFHFDEDEHAADPIPPLPSSPVPVAELSQDELYFGDAFQTAARTITETDLVSFAQLSGTWSPYHCDREWAENESAIGARVAQHELVVAATTATLPIDVDRLVAARDRYLVVSAPTKIGDTVHGVGGVTGTAEVNSDMVKESWYWHVVNQRGEDVLSLTTGLLMRPRLASPGTGA